MKKLILCIYCYLLLTTYYSFAQVQWASKLIDFSSEYKSELIQENSTRCSAVQVLGYPNVSKYGESSLAWSPAKQQAGKEFVTVGFSTPQTVQQVIVGETFNAGSVCEIILYDNSGKKYTVYENKNPSFVKKYNDLLTYFKIKPVYNVNKLKLILNTDAIGGGQEIDCIGISSTTAPYIHNINVIKYSETVGQPENLGPNINSQFYDHLPLISPDASMLYFIRKLTNEENSQKFDDDIYVSQIMPSGKFSNAQNIGPPLNNQTSNFVCFISRDNNRLYVANKYIKNTHNYTGLSVSSKLKNGEWSKPKSLDIPNLYNKNEFAHYHMSLDENIALMCVQRDDSYGDLDIYVSQKYSDGEWSSPKNLGPIINTVGAEGSVFLAADGRTLYFSSTGHPGFGSYDMFMSKRLDDSWTNWSKPLNLGNKINTEEMDIYYTIPAAGDYAYFSSGLSYFGKNDLYRIRLPKEARPEYVDINKFVAAAPINKNAPATLANTLKPANTSSVAPVEVVTKELQRPSTTTPKTVSSTVVPVSPEKSATNPAADELQNKLESLKKQQEQLSKPTNSTTIVNEPVTQKPISITTTAPRTEVKKEVINSIEPFRTQEEQRPKPEITNTIRPAETPKPAPNILSKEEIQAREQQKNNPSVNPIDDKLNALSKRPSPEINTTPKIPSSIPSVQNPNIVTNEVDPNMNQPESREASTVNNPKPILKTSNPQTDELQQKLDDLKKQQAQSNSNKPIPNATYKASDTKTIAEQYPNPQPVLPTSNVKTDDLQKKLEDLKQQQREVGQSNKIYANPYEQKPYSPQPLKEKKEDAGVQAYDEYQKKLQELKQQQQNTTTALNNKPIVSSEPAINNTPAVVQKSTSSSAEVPDIKREAGSLSATSNPIISKYEEKLKKLKEEMAAMNNAPKEDVKIQTQSQPELSTLPKVIEPKPSTLPVETIVIESKEPIVLKEEKPLTTQTNIDEPQKYVPINLEVEKAKLDLFQQAQKDAEKKMLESIDKMSSSKQSLETDIADLKAQQKKFSDEKEKLTAQNTQLAGEKEKLELEKKKMDELLAQMQEERDKLAAEKLKMEQDKAKLDLLKKQQEKDVLTLKRSIDSLSKVQQKSASSVTASQNYDLFNVPLKVGAIAQVNNIYFVADASFLQIPSYPELDKVALFLSRNQNLKVEIGGHTNGICDDYFCQKLSTSRAKTCVDYLISKGISASRLSYKGYGKTQLLKPNEPGNSLNQRVEIKIVSMD